MTLTFMAAPAFAGCNSGNTGNTDLLSSANCQANASGTNSLAIGANSTASGSNSTASGYFSHAGGDNSTATGAGSHADGDSSTASGYKSLADGDNSTAIGFNAAAVTTNDTAVGVYARATGGGVSIGQYAGNIDGTGFNSTGFNQRNIAIGASSGQIITGDDNTAIGTFAGRTVTGTGNVAIGRQANETVGATGAPVDYAVAIGNGSTASASNAIAIGGGNPFSGAGNAASATAANAVAIGNQSQATAANSVALGQGSVANVANTVSIGAVGTERKLVNLAPGTIANASTDGVNGGQLFTANQRVANAFGGGAGLDANGQLTAPSYNIQGANFNNVGGALSAINNNGIRYYQSNSAGPAAAATGTDSLAMGSSATASGANAIAAGTGAQATQAGAIAIGMNSASTGTNAIAIGTGARATGSVAVGVGASAANGGAAFGDGAVATATNSTAIGPGATATHANAVAIGSGSTTSAPNTVSVGSAGNERRITNVAAGVNQTDAVNVSQLQGFGASVQSQIGGLQTQINDNRWEARGGIALALAAGNLHFDNRPGKLSVAGSYGNFKGASGLAFGLGYAATDRLRFSASFSGSPDQGSYGGAVGGSLTLN